MKRLCFFALIVLLLIVSVNNYATFVDVIDAPSFAEYTFVLSDLKHVNKLDLKSVVNGDFFIVTCNKETAKNFGIKDSTIVGQAVSYFTNFNEVEFLIKKLKITQIKCETVGDIYCFYGFTNSIKDFVLVNDNKVNIQIAYSNNKIKIGTPVILDSY